MQRTATRRNPWVASPTGLAAFAVFIIALLPSIPLSSSTTTGGHGQTPVYSTRLRGGGGADEAPKYKSKLTRSYSVSSVVPTAGDPNHLVQTVHGGRNGELDLNMVTTRRPDNVIEVVISSEKGADFIGSKGGQLILHWAVDTDDDGTWSRPPKQMLPDGTHYRFEKQSVHTNFKLEDGKAQVKITVPDHKAPMKMRFIIFHTGGQDPNAKFWFKNSHDGEFEVYVCPELWKRDIEFRIEKEKNQKGGIFSTLFRKGQTQPQAPERQFSSEVIEDTPDSEPFMEPSPPRNPEWHWSENQAVTVPKLKRSASEEERLKAQEEEDRRVAAIKAKANDDRTHVKVNVMMPLDIHKWALPSIERRFQRLKDIGVHGVMCDMWWGLVEAEPRRYDFSFYMSMVEIAERVGIEVEFVMSFHKCGGNVGDNVYIPLPRWVRKEADEMGRNRVFYTDRSGDSNDEYISCGADETVRIKGRTPVCIYSDFMQAFSRQFDKFFHTVLKKVQVGLGPAGELRYPSFPLSKWCYPGAGEFQCYDKNMQQAWADYCEEHRHKDWAKRFPDVKGYASEPSRSRFLSKDIHSDYGKFFMRWYADFLLAHGDRVLSVARECFAKFGIEISGKIAGLHWLYTTAHHGAEICAGYYNTNHNNAYSDIAQMFKRNGATFDFTCMEIKTGRDVEHPYLSDPEALVKQAAAAAKEHGVKFAGENALPVDNWEAFDMILQKGGMLDSFCFLRFEENLHHEGNDFRKFVKYMGRHKRPVVAAA